MIVPRRVLAVLTTFGLIAVLLGTLLVHRANQTVFSADFYTEQLTALGAFDAVHDEVLPTALEDFLAEQESKLPDNLANIDLPTDPASQQLILNFARTAVPPEYLEATATEGIEAFIAYLTGQRDDLDWNLSLNEPIVAAFAANGSNPSAFEDTWRELSLTDRIFRGLSSAIQIPELETFQSQQAIQMLALFREAGLDLQTSSALAFQLYEAAPEGAAIPELTTRVLDGTATEADLELLQGFLAVEGIPAVQVTTIVDIMATEGAPTEVSPLAVLLGSDDAAAATWFETELFGAVRELTAYLTGSGDDFAVAIGFAAQPGIAEFAAGPLKATPQELTTTGYRLDRADIDNKLAEAEDPPIATLDEVRALFNPAGRTITIADLQNLGGAPTTAPVTDTTIDTAEAGAFALDTFRGIAGPISNRGLLFGAIAVLLTTIQIAIFGGRQWWSRIVWGASALAAASFVIVIVAGPLYSVSAAPLLADSVADTKAELVASDNAATPLGLRALDQLEAVVNQQVGAVATNALVIGIVALLLAAAVIAAHTYLDRRDTASEEPSVPYSFEDAAKTIDEDHDSEKQAAA